MKPDGTGSPIAQYEVVEEAEVAMLMAAMVSPQMQYVCIPVIPAEDRRAPDAIDVVNVQSAVGFWVEAGAGVVLCEVLFLALTRLSVPVLVASVPEAPDIPVGCEPVVAVVCTIDPE